MHVMMPVTSMSNCRNKTDRRGSVCCDGLLHPRHTSGYFSSTWAQHTTQMDAAQKTDNSPGSSAHHRYQAPDYVPSQQPTKHTHTLKTLLVATLCNTKKTMLTLSIGWLSEQWGLYAFLGREHTFLFFRWVARIVHSETCVHKKNGSRKCQPMAGPGPCTSRAYAAPYVKVVNSAQWWINISVRREKKGTTC